MPTPDRAAGLTRMTAAELAAAIAGGQVSALEVTEAHLGRIDAVDERLHVFLHVAAEGARAAARAADERRAAGEVLGPLAGVPLALKDVFTTRDMPTTCASRILGSWQPPYDATVTRRALARLAWCCWVSRTWTSSRWARPPRTRRSGPPATRGTWPGSPEGRRAARPRRSRASRPRSASAPTPAGPSGSPPRCAGSSGSSRPTAGRRGTG